MQAAGQRRRRAAADQPARREVRLAVAAHRPAAPQGRLGDGDTIPLARTGRNPEVEEVLGALSLLLNGGGVAQLKTINVELNKAMARHESRHPGRDPPARHLRRRPRRAEGRRSCAPSTGSTGSARRLAAQKDDIATAIDDLGPGLKVLADQRKQLTTMLTALVRARQGRHPGDQREPRPTRWPTSRRSQPILDQAGRGRRQPAQGAGAAADLPVPAGGDGRGPGRLHQPADHRGPRPAQHPRRTSTAARTPACRACRRCRPGCRRGLPSCRCRRCPAVPLPTLPRAHRRRSRCRPARRPVAAVAASASAASASARRPRGLVPAPYDTEPGPA